MLLLLLLLLLRIPYVNATLARGLKTLSRVSSSRTTTKGEKRDEEVVKGLPGEVWTGNADKDKRAFGKSRETATFDADIAFLRFHLTLVDGGETAKKVWREEDHNCGFSGHVGSV